MHIEDFKKEIQLGETEMLIKGMLLMKGMNRRFSSHNPPPGLDHTGYGGKLTKKVVVTSNKLSGSLGHTQAAAGAPRLKATT